jgi:arsenate reductase
MRPRVVLPTGARAEGGAMSAARVLFLCTGNSCRSQMAEGFARSLHPSIEAHSAGTRPHGVNPLAARVMREVGIDLGAHRSKHVDDLAHLSFDLVVTVCDAAHEACPVLPGAPRVVHRGFDDPPRLAAACTSDEEALPHYRRVRDEIGEFIHRLPELLRGKDIP